MVVERADSRLITAIKTRNPLRLLGGESTWSLLRTGERVTLRKVSPVLVPWVISRPVSYYEAVIMDNEPGDDAIRYIKHEYYGFNFIENSPENRDEHVLGDKINEPNQPWTGKVRFTESQKTPV